MATAKRDVAARLLEATGLLSLLLRLRTWNGILTLNYHRVGEASTSPFDPELFSATPEGFDQQIRFLKAWCDIIVPENLETARRQRRGRFALITFDDGYIDNFTDALPILRAHGTRTTFFLATGLLDRPRVPWWDEIAWMTRVGAPITIPAGPWLPGPLELDPAGPETVLSQLNRVYQRLPPASRGAYLDFLAEATGRGRCGTEPARDLWMTWEMVRQLRSAGMALGGHTHEHIMLSEHARSVSGRSWRPACGASRRRSACDRTPSAIPTARDGHSTGPPSPVWSRQASGTRSATAADTAGSTTGILTTFPGSRSNDISASRDSEASWLARACSHNSTDSMLSRVDPLYKP